MPEPLTRLIRETRSRRVETAYGFALLLTMTSILLTIAAGDQAVARGVAGVMQGLTLIAVLFVSGTRSRAIVLAIGMAFSATLVASILGFAEGVASRAVPLLWALIVGATMAAIVRRLQGFGSVNVQTVLGLLTIYLLLGLLFAYVDLFVAGMPGGFFGQAEADAASFVYFSYVTLATVGYGDLTPVAGLPQALAVLEALVGQLYLVSVVALAVGRFGRVRSGDRER